MPCCTNGIRYLLKVHIQKTYIKVLEVVYFDCIQFNISQLEAFILSLLNCTRYLCINVPCLFTCYVNELTCQHTSVQLLCMPCVSTSSNDLGDCACQFSYFFALYNTEW